MRLCRFALSLPATEEQRRARTEVGLSLPDFMASSSPERREEFFWGRYCAHQVLLELTGKSWPTLGRREDRSPEWPSGVLGSITHTQGYVGAVAAYQSECRAVGIDVQNWMSAETASRVHTKILRSDESFKTVELPFEHSLTILFAAKECLYKALNPLVGEFFGFQEASAGDSLSLSGSTEGQLILITQRALGKGENWVQAGTAYEVHFRFDSHRVYAELVVGL